MSTEQFVRYFDELTEIRGITDLNERCQQIMSLGLKISKELNYPNSDYRHYAMDAPEFVLFKAISKEFDYIEETLKIWKKAKELIRQAQEEDNQNNK